MVIGRLRVSLVLLTICFLVGVLSGCGRRAPQVFAEAMAGGGHAGGGIAGAGDGSYAFVGRIGGGFDQTVTDRFAVRFEADYVRTTFANGVNGQQNNYLFAVGFVFHWSRGR